jgi:hypothetical protein
MGKAMFLPCLRLNVTRIGDEALFGRIQWTKTWDSGSRVDHPPLEIDLWSRPASHFLYGLPQQWVRDASADRSVLGLSCRNCKLLFKYRGCVPF